MEDLLNEEEFIPKTMPINWRYIIWFYILAFFQTIQLYYLLDTYENSEKWITLLIVLPNLLIPFILVILLFFSKHKMYMLDVKQILFVIFCLVLTYWVGLFMLSVFDRYRMGSKYLVHFEDIQDISIFSIVLFLLYAIIVIPTTKIKKKKTIA